MNALTTMPSICEVHSIIKFLAMENNKGKEICVRLCCIILHGFLYPFNVSTVRNLKTEQNSQLDDIIVVVFMFKCSYLAFFLKN